MTEHDPAIDPRIAALADGSLTGAQGDALQTEIEASAQLRTELREQRRAVSLLRATDEIVAPAALRASIDELTAAAGRSRRRRWRPRAPRVFVPIATAVAIAVVAIVIAVQGPSGPSVTQTAHLALAAATGPAPMRASGDSDHLAAHVGPVAFPSYQSLNHWRASGRRRDTLHGRSVTTVFYRAPTGRRVGYSIVSGHTLPAPRGRVLTTHGVRYVFSRVGTARLISWWQGGHTCLIAGRAVSDQQLLALAAAEHEA